MLGVPVPIQLSVDREPPIRTGLWVIQRLPEDPGRGSGNNRANPSVSKTWQEASHLGYDAYKRKLMSEGKYRQKR
jgi:hypothetical protein